MDVDGLKLHYLTAGEGEPVLMLHGWPTSAYLWRNLKVPVRLIYGTGDRILSDVAKTMQRVKRLLPQAELTALPGCGHFSQEDEPEKIAGLLSAFLVSS